MICFRRLAAGVGAALVSMAWPVAAHAEIPASLKSTAKCSLKTPAPGYAYRFCDDGIPPHAGRDPNPGAGQAIPVPAKYDGYVGLPEKADDAVVEPGADAQGDVALDADISIPTIPAPRRGYPLLVMMHGFGGYKADLEATDFDAQGERWHYSNAWFASRGYVVVNYTARGHRRGTSGSTGETQLDSRRYEINDFQQLAGEIADDPFFDVDPRKVVVAGGSYGGGFSWLALTDPLWRSPDGERMTLAAAAPKYGWTDLVYALVPNGGHFQSPDRLPAFDGSDSVSPLGLPKQSITGVLFTAGQLTATLTAATQEAATCMASSDPFETNPLCTDTIANTLPAFIADRSAYYQNRFFRRIAHRRSYRVPVFSAGTLSDPLFPAIEHLRMSNRLRQAARRYPIQEYYGDYLHFDQNKATEWGDVCGADRHVCLLSDYPGGDVNATPQGQLAVGVNTRLNRFLDHFAEPPGNSGPERPRFDVTASLQTCPQNATADFPAGQPGERFTADRFGGLAPNRLRLELTGTQTTTNQALPNLHAFEADPLVNFIQNRGRCPFSRAPAGPGVAVYESEPLAQRATMIGGAIVSIDYSASTAEGNFQLDSRLYDVFPDGTAVMVDRGPKRVTEPSGTVTYQLHGNGWRFEPGHRIRIEIAQDDARFVKRSNVTSTATLTGVRLRIPVRENQRRPRGDDRD
jgi:predicted acyl esterase